MFRRDKSKGKPKEAEKRGTSSRDRSFNIDDFIARASGPTVRAEAPARREETPAQHDADVSVRGEPKNAPAPSAAKAAKDAGGGSEALRLAIDELISFDVETIKQRPDPRLDALKIRINNALADIFGRYTKEYKSHAIWSLDTTPVSIGGAWHPLSEVREGYQKGIYEAIKMANSVLEKLEEDDKARKQEEEKATRDPKKSYIELKCALGELKSFDVSAIRQRPDPRAKALTDRINDTLAEIFGRNSNEYHSHAIWTLDTALPITISGAWQSLSEVREGYQKGINDAIVMVTAVLAELDNGVSNRKEEEGKTSDAESSDAVLSPDADKAPQVDAMPAPGIKVAARSKAASRPAVEKVAEDPSPVEKSLKKSAEEEKVVSPVSVAIPPEISGWALQEEGTGGKSQETMSDSWPVSEEAPPTAETAAGSIAPEEALLPDAVAEDTWSRILEAPDQVEADGQSGLAAGPKSTLEALEEKLHELGAEEPGSIGLDPDLVLSDDPGLMVIDEDEAAAEPSGGKEPIGALVIDGDDQSEEEPFVECGDMLSAEIPEQGAIDDGSLVLDEEDQFSLDGADEPVAGPGRLEELEKKLLDFGGLESLQDGPSGEDEAPTTIVLDESAGELAAILPEPPEALFVLPEHDERLSKAADDEQDSARFRNLWDKLQEIEDGVAGAIEIDLPPAAGCDPLDSAPALQHEPEADTVVDAVVDAIDGADTSAPLFVESPVPAWYFVSQIPSALETGSAKGALSCLGSCFAMVAVALPELADEPEALILEDTKPDGALLLRIENHEEPYRPIIRILAWTAGPDDSKVPQPEAARVVINALPAAIIPALAWHSVSQIPSVLETGSAKGALSCLGSCFAMVAVALPELADEPEALILEDTKPDGALLLRIENHEEPYRPIIRILAWTAGPDLSKVPQPEAARVVINALPAAVAPALAWNFASRIPSVLETRVLPLNVWEHPESAIIRLLAAAPGVAVEESGERLPAEKENEQIIIAVEDTNPQVEDIDLPQVPDAAETPIEQAPEAGAADEVLISGATEAPLAIEEPDEPVPLQDQPVSAIADESETDTQAEMAPVPPASGVVPEAAAVPEPVEDSIIREAGAAAEPSRTVEEPLLQATETTHNEPSATESLPREDQAESDPAHGERAEVSREQTQERPREPRARKPEARHNPFLGVSESSRGKEKKGPSADVLDAQIAELQLRIDELKAFDIEKIKERADPKAKALGDAVNKTLAGIFGQDTYLYWQHAITSLERTLVIVGGPKPSPEQVRDAYRKGIKETVTKLTATLGSLSEKRKNLATEPSRDVRSKAPRGAAPQDDTRVVSFSRREEPSRESTSRKPEARHNPFLGVSESSRGKEKKGPSADVLDAQIAELQLRIDELKAFDIEKIKERADPKAKALGDAVNKTLAGIFGQDTYLYWQHAITSLERTLVIVGGPKPSPEQVRDAYRKGMNDAMTKLTATQESLSEKRRNLTAQAAC